jgi:hypothetical protein
MILGWYVLAADMEETRRLWATIEAWSTVTQIIDNVTQDLLE